MHRSTGIREDEEAEPGAATPAAASPKEEDALSLWCRRALRKFYRRFALQIAILSWLNLAVLLGLASVIVYGFATRQFAMPPILLQAIAISTSLVWAALPVALFIAHSGFRSMQPPEELSVCMDPQEVYRGLLREGRISMLRLPLQLLMPVLILRLLQPLLFHMLRGQFELYSLLEGALSAVALLCSAYVLAEIQLALCIRLAPVEENRLLLILPGVVFAAMSLFSAERVFGYWGTVPPMFEEPGSTAMALLLFGLVLAGTAAGFVLLSRGLSSGRQSLLAAPFAAALLGQALGLGLYNEEVGLARMSSASSALLRSMCPGNPRAGWASTDIDRTARQPYYSPPSAQAEADRLPRMEISPGLSVAWPLGATWYMLYFAASILVLRRLVSAPPPLYRGIHERAA